MSPRAGKLLTRASITAPPVPEKPILIRVSKLRSVYRRPALRGKGRVSKSVVIGIPLEILEATGLEVGSTMVVEAYKNGFMRVFPAGDHMSANSIDPDEDLI